MVNCGIKLIFCGLNSTGKSTLLAALRGKFPLLIRERIKNNWLHDALLSGDKEGGYNVVLIAVHHILVVSIHELGMKRQFIQQRHRHRGYSWHLNPIVHARCPHHNMYLSPLSSLHYKCTDKNDCGHQEA